MVNARFGGRAPADRTGSRSVRPSNELHRDPRHRAGGLPDVVDRDDVWMIQSRRGTCLLLEPRQTVAIGGEFLRKELDRYFAAEPNVARAIDLAHASSAEAREHFERTDSAARRKIHAGKSRSGAGDNRKSRIRQSDFRNSTRSAFCDGDSFSSSTRS